MALCFRHILFFYVWLLHFDFLSMNKWLFTELLDLSKGSVIPSLDDAAVWNSTLILASISTRHTYILNTVCELFLREEFYAHIYTTNCVGTWFARQGKRLATSGRLPRLLKHALAAATWYQMLYTNPLREPRIAKKIGDYRYKLRVHTLASKLSSAREGGHVIYTSPISLDRAMLLHHIYIQPPTALTW